MKFSGNDFSGIRANKWNNTKQAVAAGALVAGQQACMQQELTADIVELRIPNSIKLDQNNTTQYDPTKPVIRWQREDVTYYFAPVLVCKQPLKTVGLGDAISSTALVFSEYVR